MGVKDTVMSRFLGNAEKFTDAQVAQTLTLLVEHGVKHGASDIHIEPHDQYVLVRYRIDGSLRGIHKLPRAAQAKLLRQLKELAGLSPAETHIPGEGHYTLTTKGRDVEVHVAIMPVLGGEKAVLHLAPHHEDLPGLQSLGFWGDNLHVIHDTLARPHGLILVAGPKQAGKSTTLHSLLELLHNPLASIATVEERRGRRLPGITQTYAQGRGGIQMADGLHAVLGQDPNIIMIESIPNQETGRLVVHVAVTGHMVVAGLHAENASAALLHLRALGVEPFLLATAARLSMGQRLVRRLCVACRQRIPIPDKQYKELAKTLGLTAGSQARVYELEQQAIISGVGDGSEPNASRTRITHVWQANEHGCDECHHTGYQGRIAIVEVLKNTERVQKQLMQTGPVTPRELHVAALKDGFIPMALDGLIKALRGETTISEVLSSVAPEP